MAREITGTISDLRDIKELTDRALGYRDENGDPTAACRPTHVGRNCRAFVPTLTDAELRDYAAKNGGELPPGYTKEAMAITVDERGDARMVLPDKIAERALASARLTSDEKQRIANARASGTETTRDIRK